MVKRIFAVVVMIISVVVMAASIAGIIGAWAINTPLTENILNIFVPIDRAYERFDAGVENVDSRLTNSREKLTGLEEKIDNIGNEVTENSIVLDAIKEQLDLDLEPAIDNLRQTVTGLREAAASIYDTLEALNSIPMVSVPVPEFGKLQEISESVAETREAMQELRANLREQKAGTVANTVDRLTQPLNRLDAGLGRLQDGTTALNVRIATAKARTDQLQQQIPTWIDWVSITITVVLLWVVLAQVSLFIHGYYYFTGRNLLAPRGPATQPQESAPEPKEAEPELQESVSEPPEAQETETETPESRPESQEPEPEPEESEPEPEESEPEFPADEPESHTGTKA